MRLFLLCLLMLPLLLNGQEITHVDTLDKIRDTAHSAKKAALFSAVLPGAGQVYNHTAMPKGRKKAFWKVPIIYAGLGATGYFAIDNHLTQLALKEEYTFRVKNGSPNLQQYASYDNQGILTLYQQHQRSRDLMIFAFIAVYGLNILDAFVEAHFVEFDVSEDLSFRISPSLLYSYTPALSLTFNFR
ncbi:MAG: DUF5683 domain-containing protein [Brumimicrobium sp.]|nr:DUF5683 domain-containing protein [Brumimicrobium sp.]